MNIHNDFISEQHKLQQAKNFKIEIIFSTFIKYEWGRREAIRWVILLRKNVFGE
jgi:hypothetical protein